MSELRWNRSDAGSIGPIPAQFSYVMEYSQRMAHISDAVIPMFFVADITDALTGNVAHVKTTIKNDPTMAALTFIRQLFLPLFGILFLSNLDMQKSKLTSIIYFMHYD